MLQQCHGATTTIHQNTVADKTEIKGTNEMVSYRIVSLPISLPSRRRSLIPLNLYRKFKHGHFMCIRVIIGDQTKTAFHNEARL